MAHAQCGTPLNRKVSLLEGWPHFRGEFVLKSMLWDFSKWPECRGSHISGSIYYSAPTVLTGLTLHVTTWNSPMGKSSNAVVVACTIIIIMVR